MSSLYCNLYSQITQQNSHCTHTLSRFLANYSLMLYTWLRNSKYQFYSHWFDWLGLETISTTLQVSMLTITPPIRYRMWFIRLILMTIQHSCRIWYHLPKSFQKTKRNLKKTSDNNKKRWQIQNDDNIHCCFIGQMI